MTESSRGSVKIEPGHKRVRAYLNGELVADTVRPVLVWEWPYYPAYYIPAADVRADLIPAGQTEHSPSRGDAELLHVKVAMATADLAARRYPDSPLGELRELVRFEWDAMSEWFEEDEPVYTHPRDPHTRVDILASSRRVRIERGRGNAGRVRPAADPVRDRSAAALLPAAHRCPDGPAAGVRQPVALPVQGHGRLLVGGHAARAFTGTWSGFTAPRCRRARRLPG